MKHLIDTDWVIDFLIGDPTATALLTGLRPDGIAVSIITHSEVYEGIYGSRDPRASELAFRAFLAGATVLGITRAVSKEHARLRNTLRAQGSQINHRALDLLVAATALTHNLTLVTRNHRHYSDIPGLSIL